MSCILPLDLRLEGVHNTRVLTETCRAVENVTLTTIRGLPACVVTMTGAREWTFITYMEAIGGRGEPQQRVKYEYGGTGKTSETPHEYAKARKAAVTALMGRVSL